MDQTLHTPAALGARIRQARKTLRLTQTELAEIAGTGQRFISELERGKASARLGLTMHVLQLLGIDLQARMRGGQA